MQVVKFKMSSVAPMLMHNGDLANPFNKWAKEMKALSAKRKKMEEDLMDMAECEFNGSLYRDADDNVVIPARVLIGVLVAGAKKSKLGTSFKSSVFCEEDALLNFGVNIKASKLFKREEFIDQRPVAVKTSKVLRTRPIFKEWSCVASFSFDDKYISREQMLQAMVDGGRLCGVGDYVPQYGRFSVKEIK